MPATEQLLRGALDHHRAGNIAGAEAGYRAVLAASPWSAHHMTASQNLAVILMNAGRRDEAIALLERAVALGPAPAGLHYNLGNALRAAERLDEAIAAYRRAAALAPADADVHNNLGIALKSAGEIPAAIASYRKALSVAPRHPGALANLGGLLREQGQTAEAAAVLEQASRFAPNVAEIWHNFALALHDARRYREALAAAHRAIVLKPQHAPSHTTAANVHHDLGELAEAVAGYRRELELNPADAMTHSNLLLAMAAMEIDPAGAFAEAQRFGVRFASVERTPIVVADRRVRVGYLSPDFRDHSVSRFIEPLLANHDRATFEIICYSDAAGDAVTAQLRGRVDRWRETRGLADTRVSAMIKGDLPDIQVDLAGHTSNNRLPMLARRLAPLQGSFLGYPATTGVPAIDFRITDAIADPPGMTDSHFTERLVRLPRCAWCYAPPAGTPEISPLPSGVTFGSFNHIKKISPRCIALWSAALRAVPDSRMTIKSAALVDDVTRRRIAAAFESHGISADRLTLLAYSPTTAEHLGLYAGISIALDTFPYNGTTTTCEALWMGVPVITLAGSAHAGRVGASLLHAAGLGDLVANDGNEFADIAARAAGDSARLAEIRRGLRNRVQTSELMDGASYARAVEKAYRRLLQV